MALSPPRFAVCTFDRVFDTAPKRETLTLAQLVRGLLRFEVKPLLAQNQERAARKVEAAWQAYCAGRHRAGPVFAKLAAARDGARLVGLDPAAAVEAAHAQLWTEVRGAPKRDLRLWSPAQYVPGARRGGENVVHLSCLVLDYDRGISVDDALRPFAAWFHVAHSTFSHRPEHPKLRVVLPLAGPVRAEDWRLVWSWAEERTGAAIDPAMKGRGVTYALPTLVAMDSPRVALLHDGAPLLDPRALGLVRVVAPPPEEVEERDRPASHFHGGFVGHTYLELAPERPLALGVAPAAPGVAAPSDGGPPVSVEAGAETSGGWPTVGVEDDAWDERSDEWDAVEDDPA